MKERVVEYEAELIAGLEVIALEELSSNFGRNLRHARMTRPGYLRFFTDDDPAALSRLRSIVAVYGVHHFGIPRPKALLGHEHFSRLIDILRRAADDFAGRALSMGIAAAGSQSGVMRRLRAELSQALNLPVSDDGKGELFIRLLRRQDGPGWEVLVRTTTEPLSKRPYRRADVPGALNATVAYAMTRGFHAPQPATIVNLCSGTATILIEHNMSRPSDRAIAVEIRPDMHALARINARAARLGENIIPLLADAKQVPLPSGTADRLYADLPFGHHIGSHENNRRLYPAILEEASRLASRDANFIVLTHELKLLKQCLRRSTWRVVDETMLNLSGLHPRLFVLQQI